MLKCQFHCHAFGDPVDFINYSPKELIDEAARLKYDVISITCHRKRLFDKDLEKYAKDKGILLIPGIEFEINKQHILGINIDKEIEKVDSFQKLEKYRKSHPHCFIIAPHPYFPEKCVLGKNLEKHIDLFDGIENSFCYTSTINFNKKAIKIAKKYKKPLIATADCHILSYLNIAYVKINAKKDVKSIFKALKKGNFKNHTKATSYFKIARMIIQISLQNMFKKKLG